MSSFIFVHKRRLIPLMMIIQLTFPLFLLRTPGTTGLPPALGDECVPLCSNACKLQGIVAQNEDGCIFTNIANAPVLDEGK